MPQTSTPDPTDQEVTMYNVAQEFGHLKAHYYGEAPIAFATVDEASAYARANEPYLGAWKVVAR
jgi:hypothetical protein